jgi:hypothetical protein
MEDGSKGREITKSIEEKKRKESKKNVTHGEGSSGL